MFQGLLQWMESGTRNLGMKMIFGVDTVVFSSWVGRILVSMSAVVIMVLWGRGA